MRAVRTSAALVLLLGSVGCTPEFARQNESQVILRVVSITGQSGGSGGGSGISSVLQSDVVSNTGGVINDNATITLELITKNQNVTGLGEFNDVLLERYEVQFIRSDGHNQEGVDVPYHFSGPLAQQIRAPGTAGVSIVIVRHEAKEEPPLRNLGTFGGENIIHAIAEITVHGRTTNEKVVTATGRLQVRFADFAG
jgi:hypothetical protein